MLFLLEITDKIATIKDSEGKDRFGDLAKAVQFFM